MFQLFFIFFKDIITSAISSILDLFLSNLGFCLELGLLNSETETGTGVA